MIDQCHEEERVAVTAIDQQRQQVLRQLGARKASSEVARHVRRRKPTEQDLTAETLAQQFAFDRRHRVPMCDRVGRPQRAQDHQAGRRAAMSEDGKQIERGVVAPLQVLENHHEGDFGGQRIEAGRELVQRVLGRARGGAGAVRRGQSQRAQQPVGGMLDEYRLGAASVRTAADRRHGLENGQVGLAAPVLLDALAAPDQGRRTSRASQVFERGVDEGRLADAGLARHEHHLPSTFRRFAKRIGDLGSLAGAADHHSGPRCAVARGH